MTDADTMRPDFEGDEAGRCGGCGSRDLMTTTLKNDTTYAVCLNCQRVQEMETRDWPEQKMCDNCAFRKGSPERQDPYRWAEVQETLRTGRHFHCHKGLPFDPKTGQFEPPSPEAGRVTVCAGWLASCIAQMKRSAPTKPKGETDGQ